jgi:hypothetical protein
MHLEFDLTDDEAAALERVAGQRHLSVEATVRLAVRRYIEHIDAVGAAADRVIAEDNALLDRLAAGPDS